MQQPTRERSSETISLPGPPTAQGTSTADGGAGQRMTRQPSNGNMGVPVPPPTSSNPREGPEGGPGCRAWGEALPDQCFTGTPLERSLDVLRKFDGTAAASGSGEASLVVVAGRSVCVRPAGSLQEEAAPRAATEGAAVSLNGPQDLQALLLPLTDPQLDLNSEHISFIWTEDTSDQLSDSAKSEKEPPVVRRLPLYLLGRDRDQRWTFAIDVSSCRQSFLRFLKTTCGLEVAMADLRTLMPLLSREACAIAGQAVGLSQWHDTHRFCPRCGGDTMPIETGLRRRCLREASHKLYPRTDPVVIVLVESPDGQRALLGRSKKFAPGMYTCLSGFIDQCESIEEAVRREVREEAMVLVDDVLVVGSQPWPIGRYGTCELMLACMAKAQSYTIMVNTEEMEDVQWYDKAELREAVRLYDTAPERPLNVLQQESMAALGFWVPPPVAIAHHLIRSWALHDGPFFPSAKTQPLHKL